MIPLRRDNATGVEYPYDAEYDFTSRFTIGFVVVLFVEGVIISIEAITQKET